MIILTGRTPKLLKYKLSLILLFLSIFSFSAISCELVMRAHIYPPLAFKVDDKWSGIDIEYGRALSNALGCKISFIEAPWARGLGLLKTGEIDLMVNVTKNTERGKIFYFIGPQRMEKIVLVSNKYSIPLIHSWSQLESFDAILMRQRGAYFGKRFEGLLNRNTNLRLKLRELASNENRIKLLTTRRIDAFLVDELFIIAQPKNIRDSLDIHPLVINSNPIYYALSKVNFSETRIKEIQETFNTLSQTSEYLALNEEHTN